VSKAIIAIVLVFAVLAGLILGIRRSARTGLPSKDLLDRATRRAREQHAQDKADE